MLDQLLAGAGPEGVTYARAVGLLGVTDGALLDDMVDALAASDAVAVYGTVDRVVEAGHDPRRFSLDLLDRFRDLILLDAVPDAGERGLVDVPQDQLAHMSDQAGRLGGATLTRFAEIVHTALIEMRGTTSARLVLELLCARMLLPDAITDSAAVLQRLERLERRMSAGSAATGEAVAPPSTPRRAPVAADRPPVEPARPQRAEHAREAHEAQPSATVQPEVADRSASTVPVRSEQVDEPTSSSSTSDAVAAAPGSIDAAAMRRLWPEVLEVVKGESRRTRALLDNAQVTTVEGELVRLEAPKALAKMIAEDSNTGVLRTALTKVVGGEWRVEVGVGGGPSEDPGATDGSRPGPSTPNRPSGGAAAARDLPPEPDPRDDPEFDTAPAEPSGSGSAQAGDPESAAMRLLTDELGARRLEG